MLSGLRNDGNVFITYKMNDETFIDFVGVRDGDKIINDDGKEVDGRGVVK